MSILISWFGFWASQLDTKIHRNRLFVIIADMDRGIVIFIICARDATKTTRFGGIQIGNRLNFWLIQIQTVAEARSHPITIYTSESCELDWYFIYEASFIFFCHCRVGERFAFNLAFTRTENSSQNYIRCVVCRDINRCEFTSHHSHHTSSMVLNTLYGK